MPLEVKPVLAGTAEVRRASSSCHGAKLGLAPGHTSENPAYTCRDCGQPCERVLSEPERIDLRDVIK